MKKTIRYIAYIVTILLVAYNSIYFKKLDAVKRLSASKQFDAAAYANDFYHHKLVPAREKAVEIKTLVGLLQSAPRKAFADYSHALGIGNTRYFLVKGTGTITAINENDITVILAPDSAKKEIKITTEFVYGNAIRDASGLIAVNEFSNTADFNNVSAEINRIVRTSVLPPFREKAKKGDAIAFYGALELNQAHLKTDSLELVPVMLTR